MTVQGIIARLCENPKGVTADRVKKAQGLALRSKIEWTEVLNAMTDTQRQQVQDA